MGVQCTAPAFSVGPRWHGANTIVRHSLSMALLDTLVVSRIKKMLGALAVKYESPVWRETCWAHFGLTHKNIVILVQGNRDFNREGKFRDSWAKYGWKLMAISERSLERLTDEQMAEQFLAAVKVLRRAKP